MEKKKGKVSCKKSCDISNSVIASPNYEVFDRLMLHKETMNLEILRSGFIHLFDVWEPEN